MRDSVSGPRSSDNHLKEHLLLHLGEKNGSLYPGTGLKCTYLFQKPDLLTRTNLQMVYTSRLLPKSTELYWFILTEHIICCREIRLKSPFPISPTHCGVYCLTNHLGTFSLLECHFSWCMPRSPGWPRLADNLQHTLNGRSVQHSCNPRNIFS